MAPMIWSTEKNTLSNYICIFNARSIGKSDATVPRMQLEVDPGAWMEIYSPAFKIHLLLDKVNL